MRQLINYKLNSDKRN